MAYVITMKPACRLYAPGHGHGGLGPAAYHCILHPIIDESEEQNLDKHYDQDDDDVIFYPTLS
jgi:hypothetical protein